MKNTIKEKFKDEGKENHLPPRLQFLLPSIFLIKKRKRSMKYDGNLRTNERGSEILYSLK